MTVWIDPMLKFIDDDEANRNEDVDFLMHRDNLSWWACIRSNDESEERVANMDTSINDVGLALLAMKAFQERPKVYRPNFVWKVWFPHVVALFRKSGECPVILEHSTSLFLESLVQMVRENSLVAEKVVHRQPDAPVELFILLSNRLMSRAQTNPSGSGKEETRTASHIDEEGQFKMRSQRTVGLIKELLNRFTAVSRVHIVKKFLQQCPTPGLQARFLDLLRPLILTSDIQAKKLLSELLLSIVDNLFNKHWDRKKQNLIGIDLLIDRSVEISIGAITMIQMWCMVHENEFMADLIGIGYDLQGFHAAMKKQLKWWLENPSDAPKSHFRLFLLDNAIESALEQFAVQKSTSAQGNGIQ
ncbi:unnamed protein product [Pseudo-nitzschia multistriata]|uniref:Uncharacterized protein n=1 Tax=Pseudo-nitzschia multistriata TaxID=183589 RepID=A0A448Z6L5_9STRA|nr:unnamed protein product [Pseudo-nitzschia multistriata]